MKRLIAAAALLFTVAVIYFSGAFYINKTCQEAEDLLKECVAAYDNGENAAQQAKALKEYWSQTEQLLSLFTNHNQIDELEKNIHSLLLYSSSNEKEIFKEYSGTVKILLHQLKEDTVPSIHSVF